MPLKVNLLEPLLEAPVKLAEIKENMTKSVEATQRSFNTLRTGRANASLLDEATAAAAAEK